MPLFEYRCRSCDARFEALVRGAARDRAEVSCESCDSAEVERLMSAPAAPAKSASLPIAGGCPPPEAGPCGTGCCRLPG
ncbi:zinc ribbon domain-containing protein [Alienimonas sp. DA493]|uniref:FmdB family zinc ribbon protein n=1 Tax=Alienimonas sp. DA493 TaxID=3373605 RepID=UPI0037551E6F